MKNSRLLVVAALLVPSTAQAAWYVDVSDTLQTSAYPFTGPSGDPLYGFGNENYYDGDFADLDGDGRPDRVLGARYGVLFNTGGGLMTPFAGRTGFLFRGMTGATGWGEDAFQTADVDNDGDFDVFSGGNVEPFVLQTNAEFRFSTQWILTGSPSSAILIVLTDLENDGDVDLVMGDGGFANRFSVWVNDGAGNYTEESVARGLDYNGRALMGTVSGDVDGDGDFDLIVLPAEGFATGPEKIFEVALNDGTGNFTIASTFPFAEAYTDCCAGINTFGQSMNLGDIDDDGDLDLVAARGPWPNQGAHPEVSSSIFINDGNGNFVDQSATRWVVPAGFDPNSVYAEGKIGGGDGKLVDVDYDGDLDFINHAKADGALAIFINDGNGTFSYDDVDSMSYPPPPDGLGGDCDVTDIDGNGTYDAWLGVAGGSVRILLNDYESLDGIPADVPRNVNAEIQGEDVVLTFEHPPFASHVRYYKVYRAKTAGLEGRDRELVKIIGHRHQDETFTAGITRHTTTAYLDEPDVVLDGANNSVQFTDTTTEAGVNYYYTVTHVGTEQTQSAHSAEVLAAIPAGGGENIGPAIDIIGPTQQTWGAHPRIVVHYSDPAGVDSTTVRVSFDQPLGDPGNGGRAAGEDVADLAYRLDNGVAIIPLGPDFGLPNQTLTTMSVEVADLDGNVETAQRQMFVTSVSASPPSADVSAAPLAGDAPLDVDFDASGSTDADGKIYRWEWYFGDGTTGIGRQVTHTYNAGGTYTAMLLVRDNEGGVSVITQDIDVTGPPPECNLGDTQTCYSGTDGTQDVGECRWGVQQCVDSFWGECEGEIPDETEVCDDMLDNDCDGMVDEDDCGPDGGTGGGETESGGGSDAGTDGGASATTDGGGTDSGDTAGAAEGSGDDGCGCMTSQRPERVPLEWGLLVLGLLGIRRRRGRPGGC